MRLRETLQQFMDLDGITAAIVAGVDGLLIDGIADGDRDLDVVAALGAQAVLSLNRVSAMGEYGNMSHVMLESDHGFFAIQSVGNYALLILTFEREVNVGYVRFMLKRGRDRLARQIDGPGADE